MLAFLLFYIGDTVGSWWSCPADSAGKDHHRQDIWDHIYKLGRHHFGKVGFDGFAKSKQKPRAGRAKGGPFPENHACQPDKSPAAADALDEIAGKTQSVDFGDFALGSRLLYSE